MYSIYHLFKNLVEHKTDFLRLEKLHDFPFNPDLISCRMKGKFPDITIKIYQDDDNFSGGELIELKDHKSYKVSSFNSTIPVGQKKITDIISGKNSKMKLQMEAAGNHIDSLPVRDVFYLIRGRKKEFVKVCLVHGSFFQTVAVEELIKQSFHKVLEERLNDTNESISNDQKEKLLSLLCVQENFRKVRDVDNASVKLRFRIMTEVKVEGNILNSLKYPDIKDNTLNLVLPRHNNYDEEKAIGKMRLVFNDEEYSQFDVITLQHLLNGKFIVFQIPLDSA